MTSTAIYRLIYYRKIIDKPKNQHFALDAYVQWPKKTVSFNVFFFGIIRNRNFLLFSIFIIKISSIIILIASNH